MKIGIIGDTHGFFHPKIPEAFAGAQKIIHTGDLGSLEVYERLNKIAPVIWVSGNHEPEPIPDPQKDPARFELAGKKILLTHNLTTMSWEYFKDALNLLDQFPFAQVDLVIFGHTHYPIQDRVKGVYFLNPGYCGNDFRENDPTVALLEITGQDLSSKLLKL